MSTAVAARPRFAGTLTLRMAMQPKPCETANLVVKAFPPPEEININLTLARVHFPDVFDDERLPPIPDSTHASLLALGVSTSAAHALIVWWTQRPEYQKARIERLIQKKRERWRVDDERIVRRVAGLALLTELAPELFNYAAPVPLAIGIDRQIIELGMDPETTSDVLMWWCGSPHYRTAVAAGGCRFNLDYSVAIVADPALLTNT